MISSLGYLRIESADTAAWREFGVKVLGPDRGARDPRRAPSTCGWMTFPPGW